MLDIDGRPRLVFFARFDIRPGQELTYDYRFKVSTAPFSNIITLYRSW